MVLLVNEVRGERKASLVLMVVLVTMVVMALTALMGRMV
jgi:hypothetical protein